MKCESAQDWLLQCDEIRPKSWPREVRHHVKACTACYQFAKSIKKLENAWRNQPLPSDAKKPGIKFLKKIARLEETPQPTKPTPSKQKPTPFWVRPARWLSAAAAVLIVGVGVFGYLLLTPGRTQANASDVVDRLIDWNLEMANSSPAERKRLLTEKIERFRSELEKARLSTEERAIADDLLQNALLLANEDDDEDPIEEAGRINEITDKLTVQAEEAKKKGNTKEFDRCNFLIHKMVDRGINPILDRIKEYKAPEGQKKPGFHSFMKYDAEKQQQLHEMLKRGPGPGWPRHDLRKTLDSMRHKPMGGPPPKWGGKK